MRKLPSAINKLAEESARIKYDRYMSGSNVVGGLALDTVAKTLAVAFTTSKNTVLQRLIEAEVEHFNKLLKGNK